MTVFNPLNNNNLTGKYPMFLGEDLGFMDTINVTYPAIEELYHLQMSQIWNEKEYNMDNDRAELKALPAATRDVMVKTIMWQWLGDSVASRSIVELIGGFVTNPELYNLITSWALFEGIHGRSYSLIVRTCFDDPNALMEDAKREHGVLQRSEVIVKVFNEVEAVSTRWKAGECSREEAKQAIVKFFVAMLALEAIAFISSFSCTFAITELKVCMGIGNQVKAICKDEVLHTRFTFTILKELMKDPEWADVFEEIKDTTEAILNEVTTQEVEWADYIFSDGRYVRGLNKGLLKEYVYYNAAPIYALFDVTPNFSAPKDNPLPYMDKYIDPSMIQTAAQELELTNYRVAAITNDIKEGEILPWNPIGSTL